MIMTLVLLLSSGIIWGRALVAAVFWLPIVMFVLLYTWGSVLLSKLTKKKSKSENP
jgi:hypothetical protein